LERHIVVCIKSVMLKAPVGRAVRNSETCDLNPFDRPAIEVALRMREAHGGTVTAISMGPDTCTFTLHDAMALGVDRAVLLSDRAFAESDTLATSSVLAAALRKLEPVDLVLFGTRSTDSDTGQVGSQTAQLLDMPLVTGAVLMETAGEGLKVTRRSDGFEEVFEVAFPAALTVHPAAVGPRDAGLAKIATAYDSSAVEKWNLPDLELSPEQVGLPGSPTRVISLTRLKKERKCELVPGQDEEQAEGLIQRLVELGIL
jgi:electron transfer flavoprotein beta subunit